MKTSDIQVLEDHPPGSNLHRQIRTELTRRGKTLKGFARAHPELISSYQNIKLATHGIWNGEKGQKVRLELLRYAGMAD